MSVYRLEDLRNQKKAVSPKALLENLSRDLEIRKSIGIWCFAPGGGRFHERYHPEMSIPERIEKAAELAKFGITGIEAHYPAELNEETLPLFQRLEKEAGVKVAAVPFSHFYEKDFEFGSLSNPDPRVREKAIGIAVKGLEMVKKAGASLAISWPGNDGYRYPYGKPFAAMWDRFEGALAETMDAVPGVRVAIEPKGYEPVANNIYRNTAEGLLAAARIEARLKNPENRKLLEEGRALVTLNPEIGHTRMSFEVPAQAYALCLYEGRLGHTHWNSQPDGNFDQDNNIGVVDPASAEALLWTLWAGGYKGWFGIDINPENMPIEKAAEINCRFLERLKERVAAMPHEEIIACHEEPASHRGRLEEILLEHF